MIKIRSTQNIGNSADGALTKEQLAESSTIHKTDVTTVMHWLATKVAEAGSNHDWTKLAYLDEFHAEYLKLRNNETGPYKWFRDIHTKKERHHVQYAAPSDVDLVDILESIVDGIVAGLGRSGEYYSVAPSPELLVKAYNNSVAKILANVELEAPAKVQEKEQE